MATLIGPDFVALQVRDLDASARFYRETVGLAAAPGGPPDAVVFATEPIPIAVRAPLLDLDAVDRLGWGSRSGSAATTPTRCTRGSSPPG